MCVIFASPRGGKLPTMEELQGGALANDDGAGVAWAEGGKVFWKKGLTYADVEKMVEGEVLKPPCAIHFRITSAGVTCNELTHPFPCTPEVPDTLEGESDSFDVLFHNGTMSHWENEMKLAITSARGTVKVPEGEWSDSRVLAFLTGMYGWRYLEFLEGLAGDRVCLLSPNGSFKYYGNWHHKDGFFASNESYLVGRKGKGGVVGFTQAGVEATPTPATKSTSAATTEEEEVSEVNYNKRELGEMVKEMKNKSLVLGVEVRL